MLARIVFLFLVLVCTTVVPGLVRGEVVSYEFDIDTIEVNITGNPVQALGVGGQIPAPTIFATRGDTLRVTFHNKLEVESSIHWHGVLLPNDQDGVPLLNTQPIAPHTSFTFEYPVIQSGTYWYHSHTALQEQSGIYGSIVFYEDDGENPTGQQEVLLLSDWTDEDPSQVLANLKKDDDYYAFKRDSVQSWDKIIAHGSDAIKARLRRSWVRMRPMDLADVGYDAFLINGTQSSEIDIDSENSSREVLLRIINGSASSYFNVEFAGGAMTIIAADGLAVEPLKVKRLKIATAETYDVLVTVPENGAYEFRATSVDGSGYGSTFLGSGTRFLAPDIPKPDLTLMSTMTMDMDMDMDMSRDMQKPPGNSDQHQSHEMPPEVEIINHMSDYQGLRSRLSTALPENQSWREIPLRLTGNMRRYVWSFNDKTLAQDAQILIKKGENVRFILKNETMMNHPLHFHGHFFRVVNKQGDFSPLKHTVNVAPMSTTIIELDANLEEDWFFHCHNLYHMKSGMSRVVSYEGSSKFSNDTLRSILNTRRWYRQATNEAISNYIGGFYSLYDTVNEFSIEYDKNFEDDFKVEARYSRYYTQFFSTFVGVEGDGETNTSHKHEHENLIIAGIQYTLPLLVESELRVDNKGNLRLQLESDLQLSKRFNLSWHWNTDNEYRYGISAELNKKWAITLSEDSDYGAGVGVRITF